MVVAQLNCSRIEVEVAITALGLLLPLPVTLGRIKLAFAPFRIGSWSLNVYAVLGGKLKMDAVFPILN